MERTKQDAKSKDVHIKKMEETIQGLDLKIKERDLKTKYLQDKVLYMKPIFQNWNFPFLFFFSLTFSNNNWFHIEG